MKEGRGSRGPAPLPTKVNLLNGNPGKRAINRDEPEPEPITDLTPPPGLDPRAKAYWLDVAPHLEQLSLLTVVDRGALEMLCTTYSRWQAAKADVEKLGLYIKTPNGHLQQAPWVSMERAFNQQYRVLAAEFGFTPSGRARLRGKGAEDPHDELEAHIRKRQTL